MSPKQEGCHIDPGVSQSRILTALARAMRSRGFTDTVFSASDETDLDSQFRSYGMLSEEARSFVGRIDTHSYSGTGYEALRCLAMTEGKDLWMSEVDGGDTAGTDAGEMGAALFLAEKILSDMNGLLPSAWVLWQLIDNHISRDGVGGIPDSGMPDLSGGYWGVAVADHDRERILLTKKYYAFGQFTRYVRPGCRLLQGTDHILAAADPERDRLILVVSNPQSREEKLTLDLSGFDCSDCIVSAVRTSGSLADGENWAKLPEQRLERRCLRAGLKACSVTTFLIDGVRF
jgi:O-glycosyl hydrolase